MAYQMLAKHGIETPIDITPDFGICGKRSAEILTWVDKYQIKGTYVPLLMLFLQGNLHLVHEFF